VPSVSRLCWFRYRAFAVAVLTKEHVTAAPETVGQGDHGLTRLFVQAVGRNAWFTMNGHAVFSSARNLPRYPEVFGRTVRRRQVR